MRRASSAISFLALLALIGCFAFGAVDAPPDSALERLEKAKTTFRQKSERFKGSLLKDLDAKEDRARAAGDKKLVDKIKVDRARFTEDGQLPASVATSAYVKQMQRAQAELERAYAAAIKESVRSRMDDQATALEKELEELRAGGGKLAGWADLLAMIDVSKDGAAARWTRDADGLTIRAGKKWAAVRVPYAPPEEYELEAVVSRLDDSTGDFEIGTIWQGRRFYVVIDYRGISGLSFLDGKGATENETSFRSPVFQGKDPVNIRVVVKKSGVTVTADGKEITRYAGRPERLSDTKGPKHSIEPASMFLSAVPDASFRVESLRLKPISGVGKALANR